MPGFVYRLRFFIALALALLLLLSGCTKEQLAAANKNLLEQYFEDNILNQDFAVQLATDSSANLTAQYNGYTFKLLKNTLYDGVLTATNGGTAYSGSWSCNSDYSKLVITLPNSISSFSFLTREWRFTKKAIPVMELAPWGTTEPKVLHIQRL
ncbi:MAG: hypothetical protein JST86_03475 [Bacteroidetes bacterium]|nr:hypothetical protein [Bacteroidota bacterium]